MDATELIRKIQEFFEKTYYAELLEKIRKNEKFMQVDFSKLSAFNPEIADLLLDHPEEILKAAELAIEQIDANNGKGFVMRVVNLPESSRIMIRNIRSKHLGRFLLTEGIVRQKSDVRPQVTAARFECPSCGNAISVLQLDSKFQEPTRCSCGRKGRFKLLEKSLVDAQMLVLEEVPEQLEGGVQPKRVNVFLKNDLVSPLSERKTNPGSRIVIVGSIKEIPIFTRSGSQSTRFDILFESNSVTAIDEDFSDVNISKEEKEQITALVADEKNLMKKLITSIVPSIYGHDKIKEALLLQMVGGVRKVRDDGGITRGDIHMLLVGDPGGGKSQMLKRIGNVAPKGRFVSGKGVSGAGLTATVVKDEFLQGWSLEAGALVLANKGVLCIDELDKMSPDDRSAMHEALEGQTITISKANIQATLRCETTVLAAANPKFGRFDPYDTVAKQINLPPALINRFDLIFPIKDLPDAVKDEKLAKFILNLHQNDLSEPDVDTRILRKFLVYARQNVFPKLTDSAVEELKNYFIKMRSSSGDMRSVPISARQLEGLVRLSEAYARLRLKNKVSKKDALKAVAILDYCLRQVAFDEETGTIDIDRIATAVPASQRNKIIQIKEIITDLENKLGKTIPLEDVVQAATEKGVSEAEVEEMIQKLKRSGDIFEPRRGFISKL